MSSEVGRRLFVDALDLVASYLFSDSVLLDEHAVGIDATRESDETATFLRELVGRHAVACAARLRDLTPTIERRRSSTIALIRDESKGVIRGRLDVPRYIAGRAHRRASPRRYPILLTRDSPETPENALLARALRGLARQLRAAPFPAGTAEGQATAALHAWTRGRLRREPWTHVRRRDPIERLRRETGQRVRKHQTGNDEAYQSLLCWVAEWQADLGRLGSSVMDAVTEGILAFPVGEFFWNKVFEIWTLKQTASSLARLGCTCVAGPQPLHQRSRGPIYRFRRGSEEIEIWFQRQAPLGTPRWVYQDTNQALTGVPDVVLTVNGRSPLLVDAKFRTVTTDTRSEETYKMLGYAENFRERIAPGGLQGALIFIGRDDLMTILNAPDGGRLTLVVLDQSRTAPARTEQLFNAAIGDWLTKALALADP